MLRDEKMKFRIMIKLDVEAQDFAEAAKHQGVLSHLTKDIEATYPQVLMEMKQVKTPMRQAERVYERKAIGRFRRSLMEISSHSDYEDYDQ